ncbi:MAG: hypothetical protein J4G13_15955 [Dehalococcoidia bacterium]|nr:hypothetical protein [Dehalococcoidia bacterium]
MKISIKHARTSLLLVLAIGAFALLGIGVLLLTSESEVAATGNDHYNKESLTSGNAFKYDIARYRRYGSLSSRVAADPSIEVHPENARLTGSVTVDDDGNFLGGNSEVRAQNGDLWYTTVVQADGTSSTTNHRSGKTTTEVLPASMLVMDPNSALSGLDDKLTDDGWSKTRTDEFNGRAVNVYEITTSAEGRTPAGSSGVQLPHVEDLDPASFKQRVLVSSDLDMVLKHARWSVDADGNEVLVEQTTIHKSKVE